MIETLIAVRVPSGLVAWLPRSMALDFVELGRCVLAPEAPPLVPVSEGRRIYERLVRGLGKSA